MSELGFPECLKDASKVHFLRHYLEKKSHYVLSVFVFPKPGTNLGFRKCWRMDGVDEWKNGHGDRWAVELIN